MEELEQDIADFCERHKLCVACVFAAPSEAENLRARIFMVADTKNIDLVPGTKLAMVNALANGCQRQSEALGQVAEEIAAQHEAKVEPDAFFNN